MYVCVCVRLTANTQAVARKLRGKRGRDHTKGRLPIPKKKKTVYVFEKKSTHTKIIFFVRIKISIFLIISLKSYFFCGPSSRIKIATFLLHVFRTSLALSRVFKLRKQDNNNQQ